MASRGVIAEVGRAEHICNAPDCKRDSAVTEAQNMHVFPGKWRELQRRLSVPAMFRGRPEPRAMELGERRPSRGEMHCCGDGRCIRRRAPTE